MEKEGEFALLGMFTSTSISLHMLCKMPGVALMALINPKVSDIASIDKYITLSLCALLVKADLPAFA